MPQPDRYETGFACKSATGCLVGLVVVSNRLSIPRSRVARAGGLEVALQLALQREGGLWLGWDGKTAQHANSDPNPSVVSHGKIRYATLELSADEHESYYVGYANSVLWPLFHLRLGVIDFRREYFDGYRRVNAKFARCLAPLIAPGDDVWIHDYHLFLLPAELRRLGVRNRIGFFLHIPFPPPEVLTALPQHAEVMSSLLCCDLVGLQTDRDVDAFARYVTRETNGVYAPGGAVEAFGRRSRVASFPIGIDTEPFAAAARAAARAPDTERLRRSLGKRKLVIGVDRLDYTKGIPNRIEAFRLALERDARLDRHVTLLQIAPVSRASAARYQSLQREIKLDVASVNSDYGDVDWVPIRLVTKSFRRETLAGFYRLARVGLITPLRDGMNLVAKEYVAAQDPDDPGILILSRFAGAAAELEDAILVNPFDADQTAEEIARALAMPLDERRARWQRMMERLRANSLEIWCEHYLSALRAAARAAPTRPDAFPPMGGRGTGLVLRLAERRRERGGAPDPDTPPIARTAEREP
jgi:trehalose 6-phosphate synthase